MRTVHKLARLSSGERRLVLRAVLVVGGFRVALSVLPFRFVERLAARARRPKRDRARPSVDHLVWAVTVASRRVPRASCLTQALALQSLLLREGHDATLRLGVAKTAAGELEAHAWLEHDGRTVIGGPQSARFTPLPLRSRLDP